MTKTLLSLLVLSVIFAGIFDFWVRTQDTRNTVAKEFVIAGNDAPGGRDSLIEIGEKLEEQGIIASRIYFYYYTWRKSLRGSFLAGRYVIPANSSFAEMTHLFTQGVIKEVKREEITVTFKEGLTLEEMADVVGENDLPKEEFLTLSNTPTADLFEKFPFLREGKSLEGFLFPETYNFFPDASALDIVSKMLVTFEKKVSKSMREDIAAKNKDLFEVITLASIVEGEVNEGIDRGIVAGIFQNRLDIDMALQSDATIDYIKGIAEIKHTYADLEIDDPYNSYMYPGLPPGPINSPSLESIIAAANPSETDYLFFLNNATTGETVFAKTFEEHIVNKANNGL